ncbi:MAG: hypothetical protein V3V14_01965 [Saprospiraceae bacterium]
MLSLVFFTLFACNKTEEQEIECAFSVDNLHFQTFCSFNPKDYPEAKVPIVILVDDIPFTGTDDNHSVLWEDEFSAFSKSIQYINLPISAVVTVDSTGCEATIVLKKSFFD